MAKTAYFSFHYKLDAWRVQQVLKMGSIDGQTLLNSQEWEAVKRKGDQAIKNWITEQMKYKKAVVVLVGAQTASRPWVRYEIAYAWDNYTPLVGVRIHGLADSSGCTASSGANPFKEVRLKSRGTVADFVPLYNPTGWSSQAVYADIKRNLASWVDSAYKRS